MLTSNPTPAAAALDDAFAALKTYDYGSPRASLVPIDEATVAALGEPANRAAFESRLISVLDSALPQPALEYLCRKLTLVGSAASVPALARLLSDARVAYAARAALEALPDPAATGALRSALANLAGLPKVGIIQSLGARRDAKSVAALTRLLQDPDEQIAAAAAGALGQVGNGKAAAALGAVRSPSPALRRAVADAVLTCAERLIQAGEHRAARRLYERLLDSSQPRHVQAAARQGLSRIPPERAATRG